MKVDIEGMVLDQVVNEGDFLQQQVRRMIVEWHKWRVSLGNWTPTCHRFGFESRKTLDETELVGLESYENTSLS